MSDSSAPAEPDAITMMQLAQGLERMRDSLVELSLFLGDFRSELDSTERAETSQYVTQMLDQMGR